MFGHGRLAGEFGGVHLRFGGFSVERFCAASASALQRCFRAAHEGFVRQREGLPRR
jgi:hypothetical protein